MAKRKRAKKAKRKVTYKKVRVRRDAYGNKLVKPTINMSLNVSCLLDSDKILVRHVKQVIMEELINKMIGDTGTIEKVSIRSVDFD